MRSWRAASTVAVMMGMLHTSGCWLGKSKPLVPIWVVPTPEPMAKPGPLEPPPEIEIVTEASQIPEPPPLFAAHLPEVAAPKPPRPVPPRTPVQLPTPAPEAGPVKPPVPQLVPLLSARERDRRNQEIVEYTRRAEAALAQIGTRRLDTRQRTDKARAETFLRQARETRLSDLVTASNLALRAALLAESLVASLR